MIAATKLFVVNVLCRDDSSCFEKIKHFGLQSGRQVEKFKDMTLDLQTHTLFIAEITRSGYRPEGEPLTYCDYRKMIKKE